MKILFLAIWVLQKAIMSTLTTTTTSNVEVDVLNLQLKKGMNIREEGTCSTTTKPIATHGRKDKEKDVGVEQKLEDKKKLQELEMERMK